MQDAQDRIEYEIESMMTTNNDTAVITTNQPGGSARLPTDPGVAVYVNVDGVPYCFACDKFRELPENIAAIAAHIGAVRGQLRWGVADPKTAFAGFKMLAPSTPWWVTLGFPQPPESFEQCKEKARARMREVHPDAGGSHAQAADINAALDEAKAYYK